MAPFLSARPLGNKTKHIALIAIAGACLAVAVEQTLTRIVVGSSGAERRVALVIGNSGYHAVAPLENPVRDAEGVADTLHKDGFELVGGRAQLDLDKRGMERAVQDFGRQLRSGAVGLFYYSGHGLEVAGHNYLIPVDGDPKEAGDVDFELLDVDLLLKQVRDANNRLTMIVLDACRINPFGGRGLRAVGNGLAEIMDRPSGTIISYATAPGKIARDGPPGAHSPYTGAFIEAVQRPGIDVVGVFTWIQAEVDTRTKGEQQPWLGISPIHGQFFFVQPVSSATPGKQSNAPSSETPEMMLWASVKDSRNPALLKAYLNQFPHGIFADTAKARMEEIKRGQLAGVATEPNLRVTTAAAIEEMSGAYITVKQANIREKPLGGARVVRSLAPGHLLTVTGRVKDSGWFRVVTIDGRSAGFVLEDSIEDARAIEEAEWQRVKNAKQSKVVAEFLKRYRTGSHAHEAEILLDNLMKEEWADQRHGTEAAERKEAGKIVSKPEHPAAQTEAAPDRRSRTDD